MLNPILAQDQNLNDSLHVPTQFQDDCIDQRSENLENQELLLDNTPRVFPVFEDLKLISFPATYYLYLEFFHITLLILGKLLVIIICMNLIDLIFISPAIQSIDYSKSTFKSFCEEIDSTEKYPDFDTHTCETFLEKSKSYLIFFFQYYYRTVYVSLASIITALFLVCIRRREEERVINNPILYDLNLTQDLFSVLLEDIPHNVTQQELKIYLEDQQPLKRGNGYVKEILLVQDYQKCLELSKQIKNLEKFIGADRESQNIELSQEIRRPSETINSNRNGRTDNYETNKERETSNKTSLVFEGESREHLDKLSELKDALIREKSALSAHNGKAIVVLDSIHTKTLVIKMFTPSIWDYLRRIWRGSKQQATLREGRLIAKDLPEPQDLLSENLRYPEQKKMRRQVLIFLVSLILIIGGSALTCVLEVWLSYFQTRIERTETFNQFWNSADNTNYQYYHDINIRVYELLLFFSIVLVEGVIWLALRFLTKFIKFISKSEFDINCFYYSLYLSCVLYLVVQGCVILFGLDIVETMIQSTTILTSVRYTAEKLAKTYIRWKMMQKNFNNDPKKSLSKKGIGYSIIRIFLRLLLNTDIENSEFQFFNEVARAFPMITLNFAFTANGSSAAPTFLPSISTRSIIPVPIIITLLALYIGAACDKYRFQHEDCKLKSPQNMFKIFQFLRYDHFAAFVGIVAWTATFYYMSGNFEGLIQDTSLSPTDQEIILAFTRDINLVTWILLVTPTIYLFYLLICPSNGSLQTQFREKFSNKKLAEYDQTHFASTYKDLNLNDFEDADKTKMDLSP